MAIYEHFKQHFDNQISILERDKIFIGDTKYYKNYELDVIIAVPDYKFIWVNSHSIKIVGPNKIQNYNNRFFYRKIGYCSFGFYDNDFDKFFKYAKTHDYVFKKFKRTNTFIYFVFRRRSGC